MKQGLIWMDDIDVLYRLEVPFSGYTDDGERQMITIIVVVRPEDAIRLVAPDGADG
jgi:hypothetical protein